MDNRSQWRDQHTLIWLNCTRHRSECQRKDSKSRLHVTHMQFLYTYKFTSLFIFDYDNLVTLFIEQVFEG